MLRVVQQIRSRSTASRTSIESAFRGRRRTDEYLWKSGWTCCRFVVLRTTILVTEKEAEKMTDMLYNILTHRIVTMVLKQQFVTLVIITDRVRSRTNAIASVRPSVRLSVRLFPL